MATVTGGHLISKALEPKRITNVFTLAGDHILLDPALQRASASEKPAPVNIAVQRAISPSAEAAINCRKAATGG